MVNKIPAPKGDESAPLQAMIFDSVYNSYRGIEVYFRVFNGVIKKGDIIIYESTVYPGCTEEDCVPVLEAFSGLKYNQEFYALLQYHLAYRVCSLHLACSEELQWVVVSLLALLPH